MPASREDFSSHLAAFNKAQVTIAKVNEQLNVLQKTMRDELPVRSRTMSKLRRLNIEQLRNQLSDIAVTAFAEAKPPTPFG